MAWRIGQRAVCVEDEAFFAERACFAEIVFTSMDENFTAPAVGAVYVVVGVSEGCQTCGGPRLMLDGFGSVSFHSLGFRPAVDAALERLAEIAANPPVVTRELEEIG